MAHTSCAKWLTASLLLTAVGCAAPPADQTTFGQPQSRSSIVGGQQTSAFPATGMLLMYGQTFCTGTLIGPRTVLTAGHCVEGMDPAAVSFGIGPNENNISVSIPVASAVQHPGFDMQQLVNDIAIVTLSEDAPVAPMAVNTSMNASWVGRTVTLVGYGVSNGPAQSGAGIKRKVDVTIDQVGSGSFQYTTIQGKSACNGDSGGPAYADVGGQTVVAGVTSYGDQNCQQFGVYTRVDAYLDFINQHLGGGGGTPDPQPDPDPTPDPAPDPTPDPGTDPGTDGCQGETFEGRCQGDKVIWCEANQVYGYQCDWGCAFNPDAGFYDCVQ
jgi:secreted trypsin-like serine protease